MSKNIFIAMAIYAWLALLPFAASAEKAKANVEEPMIDSPVYLEVEVALSDPAEPVSQQQPFNVDTVIRNTGKEERIVQIWSCSYPQHWLVDNEYISIEHATCHANVLTDVRLAPGETYTRKLSLKVFIPSTAKPIVDSLTFRLAFQLWMSAENGHPQGKTTPAFWSNPITIKLKD